MNQDRKRILEMVQEGKLSAQEAIILLDALEGNEAGVADTKPPIQEKAEYKQTDTSSSTDSTSKQESNTKDTSSTEDTFYTQLENAGERIFDFVNSALRKIKDIDWQITQSVEIPHVFQQADDGILGSDFGCRGARIALAPAALARPRFSR